MFGVSASFNDSVVYITDIQLLDSAWVDEKTGFLLMRNEYSNQLRSFFTAKGQLNRTCLVVFSEDRKKIQKKYEKMKKRYVGGKKKKKAQENFDYRELDVDEFQFQNVAPAVYDEEVTMDKKAQKKAEKARKKMEKDKKKSPQSPPGSEAPSLPPRR